MGRVKLRVYLALVSGLRNVRGLLREFVILRVFADIVQDCLSC